MMTNPFIISLCLACAILLFIVGISAIQYESSKKRTILSQFDNEDWLFYNFSEKFFDALFPEKHPDEIIKQFGINVENYYNMCELVEVTPQPKKLASHCVYGLLLMLLCFIASIFINPWMLILGILVFIFAISAEKVKLNQKASEMRYQVQCELPDFLDLLSSELAIGLPIEQAMQILSLKVNNRLSREFLGAMNAMELGASDWLQALESVAIKYDIETLNDFVSKVSIAYSKGISISNTVFQEAQDIKESHLLLVKEKAGKMINNILLPIAVFQMVPLLVFILLPALMQVKGF